MSDNDGKGRDVVPGGKVPSVISLGPHTTVDLSFLSDAERNALMQTYATGVIDIAKKAHELHLDVAVLKSTLEHLSDATKKVSDGGNAVTLTHSQSSKLGRTEIKMGNTDEARSGKLSSSQSGITDWTPYYIFAAIGAVVILGFLFIGRH